ncbi:MAG: DUF1566 domain-containing protein [Spirochaetota bacterium]
MYLKSASLSSRFYAACSCISFALLIHPRCQSWDKFWLDGAVTRFSFEASATRLGRSVTATISGDQINVQLPYGVATTTLVATFETRADAVYVGDTLQTSGKTVNNFSSPLTYRFMLPGGKSRTYTVTVYPTIPISDTGQSNCYNNSAQQTCSAVSATFPGQDAQYQNIPAARGIQAQSANPLYPNDYFNDDTLTGLTWKACDEGLTGPTCTGTTSTMFQPAAASVCTALNALNGGAGYGGRTDWRLPNFRELIGFYKYDSATTSLDAALFPGPAAFTDRWSSSVVLPSGTQGLRVNGQMGRISSGTNYAVRCVAGGAYPAAEWNDNGDGTVRDNRSGLVYQKCSNGQNNDATCSGTVAPVTWQNALAYCDGLTLAGRKWRLPNIAELVALVDLTRTVTPYIDLVNFPGAPADGATQYHYWSATTAPNNANYSNLLNFSIPQIAGMDTKGNASVGSNSYLARCVSGP